MHSAPAVSFPVGRSCMRTACFLLPSALAGIACIAWALQSDRLLAAHGLAGLLWLVGAGLVYTELRRPAEGLLSWDGLVWTWEAQGQCHAGTIRARLDWQRGLLLEFLNLDGRTFWCWPERQMGPMMWDGLRRAVYAPGAGTTVTSATQTSPEASS